MKQKTLAFTISLILGSQAANANPSGAQVVHGTASFSNPTVNVLNVTNSHNAIINWQSFNIGQGQTTNFIQPSSSSSVLNRVIGNNPSQLLGNLNSNGRVFLINQHGILVGAGANINTGGFFGSTLNITDSDFLNGNLKFSGEGAGAISNQGYIHTGPGGNIVLIAPNIENGGVIEVDDGHVLLAAGKSITISSLENPAIQFEVTGDDNAVTNLGEILAHKGSASLFAGTLTHSGSIRAGGVVQNADGSISLVARHDIAIEDDSSLQAADVLVQSRKGSAMVAGDITAQKMNGHGGNIQLLGEYVGLVGDAHIDASGVLGGGQILVGGDYQGANEDVQNAKAVYAGSDTTVNADALENGDGGKVILWSDNATRSYGRISAKGGTSGGDGGFIETSGGYLDLGEYVPDASSLNGQNGEWLIDPYNITIGSGGPINITGDPDFSSTAESALLPVSSILAALSAGTDVSVTTGGGGSTELGDITIDADISSAHTGTATLTLNAHNNIEIVNFSGVTIEATNGVLNLIFNPDSDGDGSGEFVVSADYFTVHSINTNGGELTVNGDSRIGGEGTFNLENTNWIMNDELILSYDFMSNPLLFYINNDSTLINDGVIRLDGVSIDTIAGSGTLINNGDLIVEGSSGFNSSISTNTSFSNYGLIDVQSGNTLDMSGYTLDLASGTGLGGSGTFVGNVDVNGGSVWGGTGQYASGTLTINGDLHFYNGLLHSVVGAGSAAWESSSVSANSIIVDDGTLMVTWEGSLSAQTATSDAFYTDTTLNLMSCPAAGCMSGTGFSTVINPLLITNSNLSVTSASIDTLDYSVVYANDVVNNANIVTWTSGPTGNWNIGTNWSSNAIPTASDYVFLENADPLQTISITDAQTIAGLQSNNLLSIEDNGSLTVNGDVFFVRDFNPGSGGLMLTAATASLNGSGVIYNVAGTLMDLESGSLNKDIVSWGDIQFTAGSSFEINRDLYNQGLLAFDSAGVNTITGVGQIHGTGEVKSQNASVILDWSGILDLGTGATDMTDMTALSVLGGAILNVEETLFPTTLNLAGGVILDGAGNLVIQSGSTVNIAGAAFSGSSGTLNVNNQGTINVGSGGILTLTNANLSNASGLITGAGGVYIDPQSTLLLNATDTIENLSLLDGTIISNGYTNSGNFDWNSGTVTGTGLITSGNVMISSGTLNTDWLIAPTGVVNWVSAENQNLDIIDATITNRGEFTISSFINTQQARLASKNFSTSSNASFINEGLFIIDADAFPGIQGADIVEIDLANLAFDNVGGTIGIASGTFRLVNGGVAQDLVLDQAGESLQGYGTFDGNVINVAGTVSPGRSDVANDSFNTGTLTITGDFIQRTNGTLVIKMDSTVSGLEHDVLDVGGTLDAGGAIRFAVINGNTPTQLAALLDQSFEPLKYSSFANRFASVDIPAGLDFTFSDTGVISISSNNVYLNELASQLEVLFENEDLNHRQIVRVMKMLDGRVELLVGDDDEDDRKKRAPRLVCK